MEKSSEENNAASAVFNNQILVQAILEHVTNDIRDNMSFRLVNKTFRNSCHAMLRKNHQKVKIEYMFLNYEKEIEKYTKTHVYINYHAIKISNVDNYFHLIKNVANVKVDSISVKNLFLLTKEKQKIVHDSITRTLIANDREAIKILIGMDEICYNGCEACTLIPRKCLEYGQIRIKNLRESFAESHFFEKLIIADYFLDSIANICVKSSRTKKECLNAVENLVNSKITCETLVLKISETQKLDSNRRGSIDGKLESMPQEVLEIILKKWRVQSLVLKFVETSHRSKNVREWMSKDCFSNLCLYGHFGNGRRLKVSNVCIDFKDSQKYARSLQTNEPLVNIHRRGQTLVSNIRRLFICDKLSIECSHWKQRLSIPITEGVERFMEAVSMEAKDNLEVNIRFFPKHRNSQEVFQELIEKKDSDSDVYPEFTILTLPSPLPISHRSLEPIGEYPYYRLEEKEWIGDAFRMIHKEHNLVINWEFMIEKDQ
ncbi:unnamed protein product [Caenorhabditis brenneri]